MPIELSTQLIHASIAQVLQSIDPNAEIFDNPTQQGSPYPAWYIVHRQPVERQREVGNRYVLVYYIDIWYMLKQNITRLYDQYTVVAEQLEERVEHLPIYGYEGVVVHTHDNSWGLELNAMKYSITLRLRCSRNTAPVEKMRVIEDLQVFIKGLGLLKKIRYLCSQFPQFDMGIETTEYCRYGNSITLPIVSGIYRDNDGIRWEPLAWNVGQMGDTFGPVLDDMTINLFMGEVIGLDTCIGGTVGVGENVGKDIIWRIQGMTRTDWRTSGPIRALEADAGVSGSADLFRDEWEHRGPVKAMAGEPVMGGTVEPYTPPPKYYTAYFNPGQGNDAKSWPGSSWSMYGGISAQMFYLNQSDGIPFDSTKRYWILSVFYVDGTVISDPLHEVYFWKSENDITDVDWQGKHIERLVFKCYVNNKITGKPCGCTYEIREA